MELFQLAPLFRNGAVLCRNKEIRIWGTAEDGKRLTLILKNEWNQELGRDECPVKEGKNCYSGCVATAMAQAQSSLGLSTASTEATRRQNNCSVKTCTSLLVLGFFTIP